MCSVFGVQPCLTANMKYFCPKAGNKGKFAGLIMHRMYV